MHKAKNELWITHFTLSRFTDFTFLVKVRFKNIDLTLNFCNL